MPSPRHILALSRARSRSLPLTRSQLRCYAAYTPPTTVNTYSPPTLPPTDNSGSNSTTTTSRISNYFNDETQVPKGEDYASATEYTLKTLARIVRYILYGTLSITALSVLTVEGIHQYVERYLLAYPAHSPYLSPLSPESSLPRTLSSDDASYYGWEEDSPSWTGDSISGGTSRKLGWNTRHALRSAWVCLEWGAGAQRNAISKKEGNSASSGSSGEALKGMISNLGGRHGSSNTLANSNPGVLNTVDAGHDMAESYLSAAIVSASTVDGIVFPAELSVDREKYPVRRISDSLSSAVNVDREAIDILLRHAEVLERMGTSQTLSRSLYTYERVLVSLVDAASSSSSSSSTTSSLPAGSIQASTFTSQLQQSEILKLSKKLSDISCRMGDWESGKGWSCWGLERVGMSVVGNGSGSRVIRKIEDKIHEGEVKTAGWFGRWFGSSSSSPVSESRSISTSNQVPSMETISTSSFSTMNRDSFSPALLRSVVGLLSSHATHLVQTGDLNSGKQYERLILDLTSTSPAPSTSTSKPTPSLPLPTRTLHTLFLTHRHLLTLMHLSEINHAMGQDEFETLDELKKCVGGVESVLKGLGMGRVSDGGGSGGVRDGSDGVDKGKEVHGLGNDGINMLGLGFSSRLSTVFTNSSTTSSSSSSSGSLKYPAQRLLKDAQRSSAQNWHLLGLIYERIGRDDGKVLDLGKRRGLVGVGLESSSSSTMSPMTSIQEPQSRYSTNALVHDVQSTALDCFERAISWGRIAYDGEDGSSASAPTDGEDWEGEESSVDGLGEFKSSLNRIRRRMESAVLVEGSTA